VVKIEALPVGFEAMDLLNAGAQPLRIAATLVYSVETEAKGLTSRDGGLAAITEAIADRLRSEGLIR
jgi:hypothetical protein